MKKFDNSLNIDLALLIGFGILCTYLKEKVFGIHKHDRQAHFFLKILHGFWKTAQQSLCLNNR